jgi:hypothetical protein
MFTIQDYNHILIQIIGTWKEWSAAVEKNCSTSKVFAPIEALVSPALVSYLYLLSFAYISE